jgi:hypothetical protein
MRFDAGGFLFDNEAVAAMNDRDEAGRVRRSRQGSGAGARGGEEQASGSPGTAGIAYQQPAVAVAGVVDLANQMASRELLGRG